jgi:peptide/nickel transport system permease protein
VRAYLLSRLGQTVLVVFLSLTAVFFLMRLGGDPVLLFLPMDIQAKDLSEFRERLGFNDPVAVQYGRFVGRAVRQLDRVDATRGRADLDVRGEAGAVGAPG